MILVTQYTEVNEQFNQRYNKEFSLRVVKTEAELQKIRAKQKNISAIFYDVISQEQDDVLELIENFKRKPSEYFGVILAEAKLKAASDYEYLDQLYELMDSESIDGIINLKKSNSYPSVSSLKSAAIDEGIVEKEEFEERFPKVYQRRPQADSSSLEELNLSASVVPKNPQAQPQGIPPVSAQSEQMEQTNPLPTIQAEIKSTDITPTQNFALPNGESLSHLITQQLDGAQRVQESSEQELSVSSPAVGDFQLSETLPHPVLDEKGKRLPNLTPQQQAQLLQNLHEQEEYSKETYELAVQNAKENERLDLENQRLSTALKKVDIGGVGVQMASFLSTFEAQQKEFEAIKNSFDQHSLREIDALKKENNAFRQEGKEFRQKWSTEREKVQALEKENLQLSEEKRNLELDLEWNKEQLEKYQAMVEQFQAFANMLNANAMGELVTPPSSQRTKSEQKSKLYPESKPVSHAQQAAISKASVQNQKNQPSRTAAEETGKNNGNSSSFAQLTSSKEETT